MGVVTCQGCQQIWAWSASDRRSTCPFCGTPAPTKKSEDPLPKLVSCEDCGREVSRRAPACPHCGAPKEADPASERTSQQSSSLRSCKHCGHGVARGVEKCPNCGGAYPVGGLGRQLGYSVLGLVLALVFALVVFLNTSDCGFDQGCRRCQRNVTISWGNDGYTAPRSALLQCVNNPGFDGR